MRFKFSKIILFSTLILTAALPIYISQKGGQLSIEPAIASAVVYCKASNGPGVMTYPTGTCAQNYPYNVTATQAEWEAYRQQNPAAAQRDLEQSQKVEATQAAKAAECNSFYQCIANGVYYVGPGLGAWILYWAASFLSTVVHLSLNSVAYAQSFLTTGWIIVRDLANMFFIFILIYIALTIMLKAETTKTISMLAWTVAIALLINFSFFLTRLVIDAGNIIATQFYNAIDTGGKLTGTGVKDLTVSIMDAIGVQQLLGPTSLKAIQGVAGTDAFGSLIVTSLIYLVVAAMFWMLIFAFVHVGVKFLLRIVGLWLIIIASPLALLAKVLPKTEPFYNEWQNWLIKLSFYPAIFLFMFYIMSLFVRGLATDNKLVAAVFNGSNAAVGTEAGAAPLVSAIANVSIRLGLIIAVMYITLKVADWVVHEGSSRVTQITGLAGRAALGTTSFAGRLIFGGIGSSALQAGSRAAYRNGNTGLAATLWRGGSFLANRSFDIRNVPGTGRVANVLSRTDIRSAATGIDVGKGFKGGFGTHLKTAKGWIDRWQTSKKEVREQIKKSLEKVEARETVHRYAKLETYNMDSIDTELKDIDDKFRNRGMDPNVMTEPRKEELKAKKAEIESIEKKSWSELKTEHLKITDNVQKLKTTQVIDLKGKDIESIIKQLSDKQLEAIKEAGKHSQTTLKTIEQRWHDESKKAPKSEIVKSMVELGKLQERLKHMDATIDTKLSAIAERLAPAKGTVITLDIEAANKMKKEVESEMEKQENIHADQTKDTAEGKALKTTAGLKVKELKKELKEVEKIIEKLKEVPSGAAGHEAPYAVKYAKTS